MNLDFGKFDWNEMFSSITRAQLYNTIFPSKWWRFLINTGIFQNSKSRNLSPKFLKTSPDCLAANDEYRS